MRLMRTPPGWSPPAVIAVAVAALLAACSSAPPQPTARSRSPSSAPAGGPGCVSQPQAVAIWTQIDGRLNAIEADPDHTGASAVATGAALQEIQQYLVQQLEANHWTEHEVDRLDSLALVDPGCGGGTLQVRVAVTIVTDDYLKAGGQIDHADASVGMTLHFLESYTRAGGAWKESAVVDLDRPAASQTPMLV